MEGEKLERIDASTDKRVILGVSGELGGVHFWCEPTLEFAQKHYGERYMGGVETHWRNKPGWALRDTPDREDCWLLNGPCWHDGSSLYATEFAIPAWERCKAMDNLEPFWLWLEREYRDRLVRVER